MENILSNFNLPNNNNNSDFSNICENLDINKILVILLLLTGKITIESITVFPNDFTITLGTFKIN